MKSSGRTGLRPCFCGRGESHFDQRQRADTDDLRFPALPQVPPVPPHSLFPSLSPSLPHSLFKSPATPVWVEVELGCHWTLLPGAVIITEYNLSVSLSAPALLMGDSVQTPSLGRTTGQLQRSFPRDPSPDGAREPSPDYWIHGTNTGHDTPVQPAKRHRQLRWSVTTGHNGAPSSSSASPLFAEMLLAGAWVQGRQTCRTD